MKMNKNNAGTYKRPFFGNRIPACGRLLALMLAAVMVMQLAACGKEETDEVQETAQWVWVPEYLDNSEEVFSYYDTKLVGGDLCYVSGEWDEETDVVTSTIHKYSLADGTQSDVPLVWQDVEMSGSGLNRITFGTDGSLWGIAYVSADEPNEEGWYESTEYLCKFDAQGNQMLFQDMSVLLGKDTENTYIREMAVDAQGRLYIASNTVIWLYDAEGNYVGDVPLGGGQHNWIQSMGCSKDGRMFACYYSSGEMSGGYVTAEIDFESRKMGEPCSDFPSNGGFGPGLEKDMLAYDSSKVYEYDLASQTAEEMFSWLDCDINGRYVEGIASLEDGRFAVIIRDWENNDNGVVLLTKTSADQVVPKESLVIATMTDSYDIQSAAVKFNRSSDKYRITIREYFSYDYNNYSEEGYQTAWSDALTRLNNDITSNNCPDIIDLSGISVKQMAEKGVFEDLGGFLDESSDLSRSDFLENILQAYTYDGLLATIPVSFNLQTVVGRAADVGTEIGWSPEDIIAYSDAHPDAELFDHADKRSILYYMMMFNEEAFIDWSTGECRFDSEEFKSLLEFVNRFPDEWDYDSDSPSTPARIQNGEVLLDTAYIAGFNDIQIYEDVFEGDYTFIGFPTVDGGSGCALAGYQTYAITAKSKNKEAAWEFIKQLLLAESNYRFAWNFPTVKFKLDAMIEEATRDYYVDENGNPLLDENGEVIKRNEGSSVSYQDGWSYTYHIVTQEEVDKILALMEVAKPLFRDGANNEIINIINEDAEAFFKGQKSVDEVAGVIQSRIQMYVSTNS